MRETSGKRKGRRGLRALGITLAVLAWLAFTGAALLFVDGRFVRFYVSGEDEMRVEFGSDFTDPGVYAVTEGRLFGESRERLPLETCGAVDTGRLGTYVLRYTARFAFTDYSVERRVIVEDTTPPVIELLTLEGYEPTWMTGYAEEGYRAYDAADGDLTGKVVRVKLDDRVVYTVRDSSGNETSVERPLPGVSYEPPVITVLGERELSMQAGLFYTDAGATARDMLGNDLTDHLVTDGYVVPWVVGDYEITYSLTSELGDTVSAARTVHVYPAELPEAVTPKEKTIYLTFDDGPGPYTGQLLDVLDRYGAKATFFVTAQDPRYFDLIGRAARAGHAIGVHTTSHDYSTIYASELAFFEDFFNMEEIILEQTGSYTRLFRFPGGSSNTVSNFNPGIMTRLTRAMNAMGFQFFDWNVYSGDAGETTRSEQVAKNIKEGCAEHRVSVVLQHDIKDFSVAAVESVLQWGQANGYVFRALTLDSPDMHHGVNN